MSKSIISLGGARPVFFFFFCFTPPHPFTARFIFFYANVGQRMYIHVEYIHVSVEYIHLHTYNNTLIICKCMQPQLFFLSFFFCVIFFSHTYAAASIHTKQPYKTTSNTKPFPFPMGGSSNIAHLKQKML